jgi:hypothetical protein
MSLRILPILSLVALVVSIPTELLAKSQSYQAFCTPYDVPGYGITIFNPACNVISEDTEIVSEPGGFDVKTLQVDGPVLIQAPKRIGILVSDSTVSSYARIYSVRSGLSVGVGLLGVRYLNYQGYSATSGAADVTIINEGAVTVLTNGAVGVAGNVGVPGQGYETFDGYSFPEFLSNSGAPNLGASINSLADSGDGVKPKGVRLENAETGSIIVGKSDGSSSLAYGMLAQSLSPRQESGRPGWAGGNVVVKNDGLLSVSSQVGAAILAQSVGGFGGAGNSAKGLFSATAEKGGYGGNGGDVSVSLGKEAFTAVVGDFVIGVLGHSIGGDGGHGGDAKSTGLFFADAVGGNGGKGGNGGEIAFKSAGKRFLTSGNHGHGVVLQSIGGGGGVGGTAKAKSVGIIFDVAVAAGGSGGQGGDGGKLSSGGTQALASIKTTDHDSAGIILQSIGGGGGHGGSASAQAIAIGLGTFDPELADVPTFNLSFALGASGGTAGKGGLIDYQQGGQILTEGINSIGLMAQSIGGGGGSGGDGTATGGSLGVTETKLNLSMGLGGSGEAGGNGGKVNLATAGQISTLGSGSVAILAQSIGGGGGQAGTGNGIDLSFSYTKPAEQAEEAATGVAKAAQATAETEKKTILDNIDFERVTEFLNKPGEIWASAWLCVETGINSGVLSEDTAKACKSGDDATSDDADKTPDPDAATQKAKPKPTVVDMRINLGAAGGDGGNGGSVSINSQSLIATAGSGAHGIQAQSIGGGGGNSNTPGADASGGKINATLTLGADGGSGGSASQVIVTVNQPIVTGLQFDLDDPTQTDRSLFTSPSVIGGEAHGVFVQSIGGGGGAAGTSDPKSSAPSGLIVDLFNLKDTAKKKLDQVEAKAKEKLLQASKQEIMSFLGISDQDLQTLKQDYDSIASLPDTIKNKLQDAKIKLEDSVLEDVGFTQEQVDHWRKAAGTAKLVMSDISLEKLKKIGSGKFTFNPSVTIGGNGGVAGDGDYVAVDVISSITTYGHRSSGIFAQSIGGGGGSASTVHGALIDLTSTQDLTDGSFSFSPSVNLGGLGASGGHGGEVRVQLSEGASVTTHGYAAFGIVAQSIGGGGGVGHDGSTFGLSETLTSDKVTLKGALSLGGDEANQASYSINANSEALASGSVKFGADSVDGTSAYGRGARILLELNGSIATHGDDAPAVIGQSLGGGGGIASFGCTNSAANHASQYASACWGNDAASAQGQAEDFISISPLGGYDVNVGHSFNRTGSVQTRGVEVDGANQNIMTTGSRSIGVVTQAISAGGAFLSMPAQRFGQVRVTPTFYQQADLDPNTLDDRVIVFSMTDYGSVSEYSTESQSFEFVPALRSGSTIETHGDGSWGVLVQHVVGGGGFVGDPSADIVYGSGDFGSSNELLPPDFEASYVFPNPRLGTVQPSNERYWDGAGCTNSVSGPCEVLVRSIDGESIFLRIQQYWRGYDSITLAPFSDLSDVSIRWWNLARTNNLEDKVTANLLAVDEEYAVFMVNGDRSNLLIVMNPLNEPSLDLFKKMGFDQGSFYEQIQRVLIADLSPDEIAAINNYKQTAWRPERDDIIAERVNYERLKSLWGFDPSSTLISTAEQKQAFLEGLLPLALGSVEPGLDTMQGSEAPATGGTQVLQQVIVDLPQISTFGENAHGAVIQNVGPGGAIINEEGRLVLGPQLDYSQTGYRIGKTSVTVNQGIEVHGRGSRALIIQADTGWAGGADSKISLNVGGRIYAKQHTAITVIGGSHQGGVNAVPNEINISGYLKEVPLCDGCRMGGESVFAEVESGFYSRYQKRPFDLTDSAYNGWAVYAPLGVTNLSIDTYAKVTGNILLGLSGTGEVFNRGTLDAAYIKSANQSVHNYGTLIVGGDGTTGGLLIDGSLKHYEGGEIHVDIHPVGDGDANDVITVTGLARIEGEIVPQTQSLLPGDYTFLNASTLEHSGSVRDAHVFSWDVTAIGNTLTKTPTAQFVQDEFQLTDNQKSLASYLQRAWDNATVAKARLFGYLHEHQIGANIDYKSTLNKLMGDTLNTQPIQFQTAFSTYMSESLSCPTVTEQGLRLNQDNCAWAKVTGDISDQSSNSSNPGFRAEGGGIRLGAQRSLGNGWTAGFGAGYALNYLTSTNFSSNGQFLDLSVSAKKQIEQWEFGGSLGFAQGWFQNNRYRNMGANGAADAMDGVFASDSRMSIMGLRLRAAYEHDLDKDHYLKPYVDVDLSYSSMPGFSETGTAPLALNVGSSSRWNVAITPMLEYGLDVITEDKSRVKLFASAGASFLPNNSHKSETSFVGASAALGTFDVITDGPEILGRLNLGIQAFHSDDLEVRAQYGLLAGDGYWSQSVSANLVWRF